MYENYFQVVLDLEAVELPPKLVSDQFNCRAVAIPLVNPSLEIKLPNSIMIYGDKYAVWRIFALVAEFLIIWDSSTFVDIAPGR